jgi:hypothetical protein
MASRSNSRAERLIVNSVGEGAIWICNSNGNIENGDYIQSSDHLGYGEKQDDDLLHNYTVAKATIDCNFELDNPFIIFRTGYFYSLYLSLWLINK